MPSCHNKLPNLETIIATKGYGSQLWSWVTQGLRIGLCADLSVSWEPETVPELLSPRALSLPPALTSEELTSMMGVPEVTSTIGERQLSFLRRPRPGAGPPSASQMSWVRISRHRPSLPSLAVSTSRNIWSTYKVRSLKLKIPLLWSHPCHSPYLWADQEAPPHIPAKLWAARTRAEIEIHFKKSRSGAGV